MRSIRVMLLIMTLPAMMAVADEWDVLRDDGRWVDLDGDGRRDYLKITFFNTRDVPPNPRNEPFYDACMIQVVTPDGARFESAAPAAYHGVALTGWYRVVDLDIHDSFQEVMIADAGPSSDPTLTFYRLDSGALVKLGMVPGGYDDWYSLWAIDIVGDGTVVASCRGNILHTWFHPCRYELRSDRLERQHVDRVVMDHPVTLKRSLELRRAPDDDTIIAVLDPGTKAVLVETDDAKWCRLLAGDVDGWFEVEGYGMIDGVSSVEMFDGLMIAD